LGRDLARSWPLLVAAAVPLAVLVVFFALPVGGMVHRGFWPDGRFAPGDVLDVLTRSRTGKVVWFTLWSAGAATAVAVALGLPTAYVLHRLRFPGRGFVRALVMVPFVLPTVVVGVAFTELLGTGPLSGLHLDGSAVAIVAALAFFNVSVVVRTVGASWQALDPRREQAAAALGASPRQVFLTVTAPALAPAVASAASVVFLFCATGFGVVLSMGGLRYSNVETEIYLLTTQELDLPAAAALSLLQLAMIVLLLAGVGQVRRPVVRRAAYDGRRPRLRDWPVLGVALVALAFLVFPLVTLVEASLHADGHWSVANYRALSGTGDHQALLVPVTHALATSLLIAVEAAAMALVLGLLVAYVVSRRPTGRGARRLVAGFDGLFMLPLGVSAVTLGFGFLITLDHPPLDLRSSTVLIPIAQAMVALPLVVRTVAPVWSSLDDRQRQAAASLGAGPLRVFGTVDLPAAWRALLAATGFAFAVSLGEFGATSFLARTDNPTLPVVIYKLLGHPGVMNFGMAMAGSVVLAAATTLVMLVVERLRVPSIGAF
jgi:thiamine transport system permease protein